MLRPSERASGATLQRHTIRTKGTSGAPSGAVFPRSPMPISRVLLRHGILAVRDSPVAPSARFLAWSGNGCRLTP